jgi:hypothetical protein
MLRLPVEPNKRARCFSGLMAFMPTNKVRNTILLLTLSLVAGGCASLQPPSATGPRGNEPVYPVLFAEDSQRREASVLALNQLMQSTGNSEAFAPQLQPITATIGSLPADSSRSLYLPKVGAGGIMNEEETRESLRRFIRASRELIGSDPAKLSLVERVDQPDGSKLAVYEQRPFRYPIRGNYGKLQIRFTADRRIINLSSTCIPQADRIQTYLAAFSAGVKAEDAVKQIRENGIIYTDSKGNSSNLKIPQASEINPQGLVTYILPSKSQPDALEFHLAWQIQLGNAPVKTAYVDAVNGETIAVE